MRICDFATIKITRLLLTPLSSSALSLSCLVAFNPSSMYGNFAYGLEKRENRKA